MSERQPIPIMEIVAALEREADSPYSPQWNAAQYLRGIDGWSERTLMCRIDTRPSTPETFVVPDGDRCTKCGQPLPPVSQWSMPACPACVEAVEQFDSTDGPG